MGAFSSICECHDCQDPWGSISWPVPHGSASCLDLFGCILSPVLILSYLLGICCKKCQKGLRSMFGSKLEPQNAQRAKTCHEVNWVAVKELKLSYHNGYT